MRESYPDREARVESGLGYLTPRSKQATSWSRIGNPIFSCGISAAFASRPDFGVFKLCSHFWPQKVIAPKGDSIYIHRATEQWIFQMILLNCQTEPWAQGPWSIGCGGPNFAQPCKAQTHRSLNKTRISICFGSPFGKASKG